MVFLPASNCFVMSTLEALFQPSCRSACLPLIHSVKLLSARARNDGGFGFRLEFDRFPQVGELAFAAPFFDQDPMRRRFLILGENADRATSAQNGRQQTQRTHDDELGVLLGENREPTMTGPRESYYRSGKFV